MKTPFNFMGVFSPKQAGVTLAEDAATTEEDAATTEEDAATTEEDAATTEEEGAPTQESKAERLARVRERARIGVIMSSKEAVGRGEAALSLAVNTDMPAKAAIALLSTLPTVTARPSQSGGLADRMAALGGAGVPPDRGGGSPQANAGPLSFKQLQERRSARALARVGGSPLNR